MGEHKRRPPSLRIKLLGFVGGALVVAACVYQIAYFRLGLIGAYATGKMLGLGLIFVIAPIWLFFHKKGPRS